MSSSTEIIYDLPREKYDFLKRDNWSALKHLAQSAAHYRAALDEPREETVALRVGNATHVAVLEPERFKREYVAYPKRRAGKDWDEFRSLHEGDGRVILSADEYAQAVAMRDAVRESPAAYRYLAQGKAEVTVLWTLEAGDVRFELKARPDWISGPPMPALVDLKTCKDASPEGFARDSASRRYHAQLALYRDGYAKATGQTLPVRIVAVEKTAPYAVTVFRVPEAVLQVGREDYLEMLGRLDVCRRSDVWPAYTEDEVELTLPRWTKTYEEESTHV